MKKIPEEYLLALAVMSTIYFLLTPILFDLLGGEVAYVVLLVILVIGFAIAERYRVMKE
jgi:hypothetical protein